MKLDPSCSSFGARFALCLAASLALASAGRSQTVTAPSTDQTVNMPDFQVRDTRASAYSAEEAISTTRISVPILDIPQSVSVVTRELIDDTGGYRMLDTAKYVTPIMESSLAYGGDRYTLRGFQISQRFVDGVNVSGVDGYNMTSDTTNIERLEIIKGPNAILVPGGSPGGIVNQITKSPVFTNMDQFSFEYKEYLNDEASVDLDRVFGPANMDAARIVVSAWDQPNGYFLNQQRKGWLIAPSYTHKFANGDLATFKLESLYNKEGQGYSEQIDPSVGTAVGGYAKIIPYMPRNWSWGEDDANRQRWETRFVSEVDYHLGSVSSRFWLMADHATRDDKGNGSGTSKAGNQGNIDPLTGYYVPFTSFTYNAATGTETAKALTPSTNEIYTRSGQANLLKFDELHAKDDYAYAFDLSPGNTSTTIAGISANYQRLIWKNTTATNPPVDFNNLAATEPYDPAATVYTLNKDKAADQIDMQVFAYERLTLLDNKLIVAGGVSQFYGVLSRLDSGNLPLTNAAPNFYPYTLTGSSTDVNAGVIFKPAPDISIFAGYNRVGGSLPSSITAGENPRNFLVQQGDQYEAGVKTAFLKGRITASASVFDIKQNNFGVPNAAFVTDPTQPQFLYYDFTSKGMEIETNTLITPEFAIVGNFTHFQMRSSFGVPYRMVPDNEGAVYAKYTFRDGAQKGFGISLGLDYMDKAPGDQASGVTVASTPSHVIANHPTFYVAPRTLVQGGLSYEHSNWEVRLIVDNLTNEVYLQEAGARSALLAGLPRTFTGEFSLRF